MWRAERVEVLGVTDVARVHDDEAVVQALAPAPLVVPRLRRDLGRVNPVRDHQHPLRPDSFRQQPLPHAVTDRDDHVGTLEVEADEASEHSDEDLTAPGESSSAPES